MTSTIKYSPFRHLFSQQQRVGSILAPKASLNLAEKLTRFFQSIAPPSFSTPNNSLSDLQSLQSVSVGAKLGTVAGLGFGTLSTLAIDTSCVVMGMLLRKQRPVLGNGLVGYGLVDNFFQAIQPLTGLFASNGSFSSSEPANQAGEFFHNTIGIPGHIAAICASTLISAIVPIAAFISYKTSRSMFINNISDVTAMRHWVKKAQNDPKELAKLEEIWQEYAREHDTTALETLLSTSSPKENVLQSPAALNFLSFLLEKTSKNILQEAKEEIWEKQRQALPDSPVQTALAVAAIAGGIALVTARTLAMITEGSVAFVNGIITALTAVSVVGLVASLLTSLYQTYNDCCASYHIIPKDAKMASLAKLVANIATTALMITVMFTPGANLCFIVAIAITATLGMVANYKRLSCIQKQVELKQATNAETTQTMQALLENHIKQKISHEKMNSSLRKWVSLVRSHPATESLAPT